MFINNIKNEQIMANFLLIRDLCEQKKVTIRELARRIGRDESTIQSAIRRGTTNTKTIEAIAAVLEVPVGYFFDSEPVKVSGTKKLPNTEETVRYLKQILAEKERTIKILLSERGK